MKLGIIGGGQLGRMLAVEATRLGLEPFVVEPNENAPAASVAPFLARPIEHPESLDALAGCDVVTYEFEGAPVDVVRALEGRVTVAPCAAALDAVQDRLVEKRFLRGLDIETAPFAPVSSEDDLRRAAAELGLPAILKTRRDGYDGKGQRMLRGESDLGPAWEALGDRPLILEGFVPFDREVSLLAVRGRDGDLRFWDVPENVHVDGILRISRSPARGIDEATLARAHDAARRITEALDYVGVLTIEFFVVGDRWLANEMACRVHNSGHWTLEGAETDQFENHVRAVAGLPLGSVRSRGSSVMVNLIGSMPPTEQILELDRVKLHDYGKSARAGRKLGHATVVCGDDAERERELRRLVECIDDDAIDRAFEAKPALDRTTSERREPVLGGAAAR